MINKAVHGTAPVTPSLLKSNRSVTWAQLLVDLGGEQEVVDELALQPLLHELVDSDVTITVNIDSIPGDQPGAHHLHPSKGKLVEKYIFDIQDGGGD